MSLCSLVRAEMNRDNPNHAGWEPRLDLASKKRVDLAMDRCNMINLCDLSLHVRSSPAQRNFLQTSSSHLMNLLPEVHQFIHDLEIRGSRISKVEAVCRCCCWECSDKAFLYESEEKCIIHPNHSSCCLVGFFTSYITHNFMLHGCKTFQHLFTEDMIGWI